jgi:UDP-N-acetylglucosamine transferase subunit ALG13
MILVTVGTHEQPFDRLVRAAEALAIALDERVVVQGGPSCVATPHCERTDWLTPQLLAATIAQARLVVLHGGPSTLAEVIDAGVLPVVVPRDPARGEHVDAHQLRTAAQLPAEIPHFTDTDRLVAWVCAGDMPQPPQGRRRQDVTDQYCDNLRQVLQDIRASRVSPRTRFRGMLSALLRRFPLGT